MFCSKAQKIFFSHKANVTDLDDASLILVADENHTDKELHKLHGKAARLLRREGKNCIVLVEGVQKYLPASGDWVEFFAPGAGFKSPPDSFEVNRRPSQFSVSTVLLKRDGTMLHIWGRPAICWGVPFLEQSL